jgi:hypothetical protein
MPEKLSIELVPDLSNCIETKAKREYQKIVNSLLSSDEVNDELKEKMEILKSFLEGTDFRKLRRESEAYLMQGRRVTFIIHLESGKIKYEMRSDL